MEQNKTSIDDKFELITQKYYKIYNTRYPYYIRNRKTGADMGQHLKLRVWFFDEEGKRLKEPIFEEDCYEHAKHDNFS